MALWNLTHISAIVATSTGALEFAPSNGFGDCWNHVGQRMSGLQREASRRMSSFNQVVTINGQRIMGSLIMFACKEIESNLRRSDQVCLLANERVSNCSSKSYGVKGRRSWLLRIRRQRKSATTRILARQLVRLRQQITNLQGSWAQIRGIATHTQQIPPAKQAKVIKEFQEESSQMDTTIEMLSESIDETLDKDEAEETEELTNQVLDEIGVDIASQLSSAPKGRISSKKVENVVPARSNSTDVEDLEKRLASLRRI
ncbi:hypothetical protein IFM89_024953 [Coptis chinensis]|uniref:Uncharacterized protein n=1 Tax=Coptis chinensis TaxID=261450 RepID=A0A835IQQ0_9MAGN|nr:hypothetical protein IFM89_024953 [Coptis chinensis]